MLNHPGHSGLKAGLEGSWTSFQLHKDISPFLREVSEHTVESQVFNISHTLAHKRMNYVHDDRRGQQLSGLLTVTIDHR